MTKTFINMGAQGDVILIRRKSLPSNLVEVKPNDNGAFVVAHSETGHNHIILERPEVRMYNDPVDQFRAFLDVKGDEPVLLEHLRSYDTHETLSIQPGMYEIRRQREYVSEGFRKAQD